MLITAVLPIAADYPKNDNQVADEAGVLSESTIRTIKQTNKELKADIGATIAVCTVKTTGETEITEYAHGLFKDWKMGEGVLLLIAADDENYYFVPSVGVDKIITNEVLTQIRDNDLEEDFAAGNIDRGVLKTVSRLSSLLVSGLKDSAGTTAESNKSDEAVEEKGTTFGSVLVGIFKFLLWAVLIVVIAFVVFFIVAMYNEDCAALLQKYVFQRNKKSYSMPPEYYDERLYGQRRPNQNPNNPRRRPDQNGYGNAYSQNYRPQNQRNVQNRQNYSRNSYAQLSSGDAGQRSQQRPAYYNADGTQRQQRPNTSVRQNHTSTNAEETRAFTIPGRGPNQY